jgi:hypothetical protein
VFFVDSVWVSWCAHKKGRPDDGSCTVRGPPNDLDEGARIVTVAVDTGLKYLSTELYR